MQKYSIWSVSCRNIHIMVYCAKILVRYRYMLHENEANQLITCRFSKFLIQLCKKKRFLWGFVLKYYFFGGSCRNITVPRYWASEVLCRALFRGCAEILVLGRNIHLCFTYIDPKCVHTYDGGSHKHHGEYVRLQIPVSRLSPAPASLPLAWR